jgi:type IV secretory pathway VirB6-like protein
MFSAYDLKKIIPRAIFALVAVNLSWGLMELFIRAVQALGDGAQALIMAPFQEAGLTGVQLSTSGGLAFSTIIAGAAGAAIVGIVPVVGVAISALFGLLFAFGIIMLRKVILIGLIIIAPVAIALSVFPQTEDYAKKWWEKLKRFLLESFDEMFADF